MPLPALVWAGVEKSPGFTPDGLIEEIRRNLLHPISAWEEMAASEAVAPLMITTGLRAALDEAAAFAGKMPTDRLGLLFLDSSGNIVAPDPSRLDAYVAHAGARRGHWPSSPEIASAMLAQHHAGS